MVFYYYWYISLHKIASWTLWLVTYVYWLSVTSREANVGNKEDGWLALLYEQLQGYQMDWTVFMCAFIYRKLHFMD